MITKIDKAIIGVVGSVVSAVGQAVTVQCGHSINYAVLIGTALLTLGAVYAVPNKSA